MWKIKDFCEKEFSPHQTGVGTPKGCEAAVHAVRAYVHDENIKDQVLLKIDFRNAFNTVRRDVVLKLIKEKLPEFYPLIYQCYENGSNLFFGDDDLIESLEGVQQGDPLGPFLFALAIMSIVNEMKSTLNVYSMVLNKRVDQINV